MLMLQVLVRADGVYRAVVFSEGSLCCEILQAKVNECTNTSRIFCEFLAMLCSVLSKNFYSWKACKSRYIFCCFWLEFSPGAPPPSAAICFF